MRLVLLEIVIVAVATRSVLMLLGHAPAWPSPLMEFFGLLAGVATLGLLIQEVHVRFARRPKPEPPLAAPHIPLDRIAPFDHEQLVRLGGRTSREINLN